MNLKLTLHIIAFTAVSLLLSTPITKLSAQEIADQPCDTQYWRQMSARAWMEAEREIMMNQNLIFKPDSVLEYTCFDRMARLTAHKGGDIFTHTTYFGQPIIPKTAEQGLPKSMNNVVYAVLEPYIQGNFSHDFLGGRAQKLESDNKDSQIEPPLNPLQGNYVCNSMANVWKAAKCANFVDNAAFEQTDGFYPFETLQGYGDTPDVAGYNDPQITDVRRFPTACTNASVNTPSGSQNVISGDYFGPAGTWDTQIRLSNNMDGGAELYPFKEPLKEIYQDVFERTAPYGTPGGAGNSTVFCANPPIQTGITIYSGSTSYPDGVCTNPGCAYVKPSDGPATCRPI